MEKQKTSTNPWKGLQSYQENDTIYGRDEEIKALYTKVIYNTQTVIYGKSGIGKSSIINAGIIPRAKLDDLLPITIRLAHTTKKGYENTAPYIEQIRQRLHEEITRRDGELEELVPHADSHTETLWELLHRYRIWSGKGESRRRLIPMLLFDQFEEIFTLEVDSKRVGAFFRELADLLNDIQPDYLIQTDTQKSYLDNANNQQGSDPVTTGRNVFSQMANKHRATTPNYLEKNEFHIVIALREDFLSYLERYTVHIPVMKQNRFALLPLNEEQAAKIIMEPVEGLISEKVTAEIIQKVTGRTDFNLDGTPEIEVDAALLSLYMEQLYEKKGDDSIITSEMVMQYSDDIIKDFYEDAISDIPEKTAEYLENELITNANRRNNVARVDLLMGGVAEDDLDKLIERKLLRQFSYGGDLRIELIHDILCPIVNDRIEYREQLIKEKEEKNRLEEERRQIEEEKLLIKKKNKKRLLTVTYITSAAIMILMIIAGFMIKNYFENYRVYEQYFLSYENINGWPVGIHELSPTECEKTPLYYKLSHKGNKNGNRHTEVEVMSSNEYLPRECRLPKLEWTETEGVDEKADALNDILRRVVKVRYSANESSKEISKEELFDEKGVLLMTINYFHLSDSKNNAWALFVSSTGENMKIRDNGIDRKRVSWDSIGHVQSQIYYDAQGTQQNIIKDKDIKGYYWKRKGNDTVICYSINEFGIPTQGLKAGANEFSTPQDSIVNTILQITNGNTQETHYLHSNSIDDKDAKEVKCERGYCKSVSQVDTLWLYEQPTDTKPTKRIASRDGKGNIKEWHTTGKNLFGYPAYIKLEYDRGLLSKKEFLTEGKAPTSIDSSRLYKWEYRYDDHGILIDEKRIDILENTTYHFNKTTKIRESDTIITTDILDVNLNPNFVRKIDTLRKGYLSTTYFSDKRKSCLNQNVIVDNDTLFVHRIVTRTYAMKNRGDSVVYEYYQFDGNTVIPLPTIIKERNERAISYHRRIERHDASGNLISLRLEEADGKIIKSMLYFFRNGRCIGRAAQGIEGTPVRCDNWEENGFLYYKIYFDRDFERNFTYLVAVDEWENRSAIFINRRNKYPYLNRLQFKGKYVAVFDTDQDLQNFSNCKLSTPFFKQYEQVKFEDDPEISDTEIPYIHVLSKKSQLYDNKKGLRDGDRIIAFGKWKLGQPISTFRKEWDRVLKQDNTVLVTVLRPSTETKELKKEEDLKLNFSKEESEWIEYHTLHLTKKEEEFIHQYLQ